VGLPASKWQEANGSSGSKASSMGQMVGAVDVQGLQEVWWDPLQVHSVERAEGSSSSSSREEQRGVGEDEDMRTANSMELQNAPIRL
jgi:hypothetical protein